MVIEGPPDSGVTRPGPSFLEPRDGTGPPLRPGISTHAVGRDAGRPTW